jgi:hypothetical protein
MNIWQVASGWMSLFAALGLCLIVLNHKVNEGVIIKTGLIGMIMSLLVTFALTINETYWQEYFWRASFVTKFSLVVVCIGLLVRARGYAKRIGMHIDIECGPDTIAGKIYQAVTTPGRDLATLLNADSAPVPLESAERKAEE